MRNVICVWWGDKYSIEYVFKLYNSVERNLNGVFNFYCLTDRPELFEGTEIKARLLPEGKEGWWNKLFLFQKPLYDIEGTALYLDLDIVIVKSLEEYFSYKEGEPFIGIEDWSNNIDTLNSSVMRFKVGEFPEILSRFSEECVSSNKGFKVANRFLFGDQDWITYCIPNWKTLTFPKPWSNSYKKHGFEKSAKTGEVKLVIFHGKPDPHEVTHSWIIQNWK